MVSYSIHVIVEYNQAGSEIICRQIFVNVICVMVLVLVQLTAKIDWNMGHFLDKINTQLQSPFGTLYIFCSSGPYASTFTSSLTIVGSWGQTGPRFKRAHCKFSKNNSQICGPNDPFP